MKKYISLLFLTFVLLQILLISQIRLSYAAGVQDFLFKQPKGYGIEALTGNPGGDKGLAEGIVQTILINVIGIFFTVGGLGVVIYFVWGAVDWILSGGDKEKIGNARKKMTHAIIGLVLLSLSYVVINIVGLVVGFNPLGYLQLRGLGSTGDPTINQDKSL